MAILSSLGRRWRALCAALAVGLLVLEPSAVAAQSSLEYPVKAAFLVKFPSYVQWPSGSGASLGSPLRLCIVGDDPFGDMIESAVRGQGDGRAMVVSRYMRVPRTGCEIVYAGGSDQQPVKEILRAVAGTPVLTVTDESRGPARGMLHFAIYRNRVRFHVDAVAARESGLSISSKLLNLALSVKSSWWWAPDRGVTGNG